jgi:hypothetical protein
MVDGKVDEHLRARSSTTRLIHHQPFGAIDVVRGHRVPNGAIDVTGRLEPRAGLLVHPPNPWWVAALEVGLQGVTEQPVHPIRALAAIERDQEQPVPEDVVQHLTRVMAVQHLVAQRA